MKRQTLLSLVLFATTATPALAARGQNAPVGMVSPQNFRKLARKVIRADAKQYRQSVRTMFKRPSVRVEFMEGGRMKASIFAIDRGWGTGEGRIIKAVAEFKTVARRGGPIGGMPQIKRVQGWDPVFYTNGPTTAR